MLPEAAANNNATHASPLSSRGLSRNYCHSYQWWFDCLKLPVRLWQHERALSIANYARPERIGEIIIIVNPLFTPWALGRVVNAPDVTDDEDVDPDFLTAIIMQWCYWIGVELDPDFDPIQCRRPALALWSASADPVRLISILSTTILWIIITIFSITTMCQNIVRVTVSELLPVTLRWISSHMCKSKFTSLCSSVLWPESSIKYIDGLLF